MTDTMKEKLDRYMGDLDVLEFKYKKVFEEKLFDSAKSAGLDSKQRKDLCESLTVGSIPIFTDMFKEFYKRIENNYFYFDDMDLSNNEDLKTLVTINDIKGLWTEHIMIEKLYSKVFNILNGLNYLDFINISDDEKYQLVKKNISFDELKQIVGIEVSKDMIYEKLYDMFYANNSMIQDIKESETINEFIEICKKGLKHIDNKEYNIELIKASKEHISLIFSGHLYSIKEMNIVDEWLVSLIKEYGNSLVSNKDSELIFIISKYIRRKLLVFRYGYLNARKEESDIDISTIQKYIELLPSESDEYVYLKGLSYLYSDILNRDDPYEYIGEILHNLKVTKKENLKSLLVDYINYGFTWHLWDIEERKALLEKYKPQILDFMTEEEYEIFIGPYTKKLSRNGKKDDFLIRKGYKIGLIFGSPTSKRAFELYCNNEDKFLSSRGIHPNQFETLCIDFKKQKNLDISKKLESKSIHFLIVFELDHTTKLERNTLKSYPCSISVCQQPGQHFSKDRFEMLIDEALIKYETIKI